MTNSESFVKISGSLSESLVKLRKAGGLALVFIFVGLLFTVFSFIDSHNELSISVFVIGIILILLSFILFQYTYFTGTVKTQLTIKQRAKI
jgi:predicted signal transduction protein with EAL and GGDEF domain